MDHGKRRRGQRRVGHAAAQLVGRRAHLRHPAARLLRDGRVPAEVVQCLGPCGAEALRVTLEPLDGALYGAREGGLVDGDRKLDRGGSGGGGQCAKLRGERARRARHGAVHPGGPRRSARGGAPSTSSKPAASESALSALRAAIRRSLLAAAVSQPSAPAFTWATGSCQRGSRVAPIKV
eukprot:781344-Prymnesium_polylepis.1